MEDLFTKAMGEHGSTIRRVVVKRVGMETPDWEDIVSEVHLSLWRALNNGFRGDCSLGTLIYVIIHRRVADYFKGRYRGKKEVPILLPLVSGARSVEDDYEIKERKEILMGKLEELERRNSKYVDKNRKYRQKEVFMLYLDGWRREEIVKELGMSSRGVTNCFRRAKANLRNMEV